MRNEFPTKSANYIALELMQQEVISGAEKRATVQTKQAKINAGLIKSLAERREFRGNYSRGSSCRQDPLRVSSAAPGRQVHDVQFFLITIRGEMLFCITNLRQVGRQLVRERLAMQVKLYTPSI